MPTKYTPQDVDTALLVLADCGESYKKAEAVCGIPTSTLHEWRTDRYRERFEEIRERERPRLERRAVDGAIALMLRADETALRIHDRLDDALQDPESKSKELSELAGAAQRLATAKGFTTSSDPFGESW